MTLPSFDGTMSHPALGQVRYAVTELPDDPDQQVAGTIALMRQYTLEDAAGTFVDFSAEVSAAWQSDDPITDTWSHIARHGGRRGMQFVRDEQSGASFNGTTDKVGNWRPVVEALIRPADQLALAQPQGDCDDFAMYGAAHLVARGVPCAFATLAADPAAPDLYSHVYLVAYPRQGPYAGQRVAMDLSHGEFPGWEAPNVLGKFREWPIQGSGFGWLGWAMLASAAYLIYRCFASGVFR